MLEFVVPLLVNVYSSSKYVSIRI